ncbi:MAG TPA: DUF1493 family protein [Roseiarcus sp.]|nr:DUF1493 family protein [Roseiarcus sp.]
MSAERSNVDELLRRCLGRWERYADASRLYHDLSIFGDDASELLEEAREKLGIDFDGFVFAQYFPNEGESAFFGTAAKTFGLESRWAPLTVAHLRTVIAKRWFEPEA